MMGLDWRVDLRDAWPPSATTWPCRGTSIPCRCMPTSDHCASEPKAVLDAAEGRPGHIFNLGHGVLPDMKPENVKALVEMVHEMGQKK